MSSASVQGAKHFHAAVLLSHRMRWGAAKRVLTERHRLASHFSVTHTQWWSALRYGTMPSEHKATVDPDPLQWAVGGIAETTFTQEFSRDPL